MAGEWLEGVEKRCGGSKWHCEEEVGECGVEGVSGTVMRRWVNVV